jgi:hypothetical protein
VWHRVVGPISPEQAGLVVEEIGEELLANNPLSHAVLVWRAEYPEIDSLLGFLEPDGIRLRREQLKALSFQGALELGIGVVP